jgi:hypothetical protein
VQRLLRPNDGEVETPAVTVARRAAPCAILKEEAVPYGAKEPDFRC